MDSNPNKNHVLWMVLNIYDLWYINSIVVCVCVCVYKYIYIYIYVFVCVCVMHV